MNIHRISRASLIVGMVGLFVAACGSPTQTRQRNGVLGGPVTQVFATGEDRTFVVPDGVTQIDVSLTGAQGGVRTSDESVGSGTGGKGGLVAGRMSVTPGETLNVQVGQKGLDQAWQGAYPDGGVGGYPGAVYNPLNMNDWFYTWRFQGSGGGGSSRVWRGDQLIAISGGGGGAGERSNGGDGGVEGGDANTQYGGGGGATQSGPGAAGCTSVDFEGTTVCAYAGESLMGGPADIGGSGGGGGYFGGGAGSAVFYAASGGGGSSWILDSAFIGQVTYRTGEQSGDGVVTFTYFDPAAEPQAVATSTTTTAPPDVLPCRWGGPCDIGDTGPGGGIVFYNGSSPWKGQNSGPYLEVSNDVARMPWCDRTSTAVPGANEAGIGGGRLNQEAIIKVCSSGAASWVDQATWGEKTDWWLPNTMELTLLSNFWLTMFYRYAYTDANEYAKWRNWPPVTCNGILNSSRAWSSLQTSARDATIMYVPSGGTESDAKSSNWCALGVRMFFYGDSSSLPMPTTTTSSTSSSTTSSTAEVTTTVTPTTSTTATVLPSSTSATSTPVTASPSSSSTAPGPTVTGGGLTTSSVVPVTASSGASSPAPGSSMVTSTALQSSTTVDERARQLSQTTTTMPTFNSVPRAQLQADVVRNGIAATASGPAEPARYAEWVQVPKGSVPQTGGSPNSAGVADSPQSAEVGEFSVEQLTGPTGPEFQIGIRLPKRPAKSIVHTVRLVGLQGQTGATCSVNFRNTSSNKPKYLMRTSCVGGAQKLALVKPKKSYGANNRLYFRWPAISGGSLLEIRSVVKGVTGTPKSGLWRSRWLLVR